MLLYYNSIIGFSCVIKDNVDVKSLFNKLLTIYLSHIPGWDGVEYGVDPWWEETLSTMAWTKSEAHLKTMT